MISLVMIVQKKQKQQERKEKSKALTKKQKQGRFVNSWLNISQFKGWLQKSTKSSSQTTEFVFCKVCNMDVVAHKTVLLKHSTSEKHKLNWQNVSKITDVLKTKGEEKDVRTAEIKLCALLATNNLPFLAMDSLSPI